MSAPGRNDPTLAYLLHRVALIVIAVTMAFAIGYLVVLIAPDVQEWVISAIHAVRDEWTSWHWRLT
jgi:hypothetical protein